MSVKLIAYTKCVLEEVEDLTAYVARVSNPNNQLNNNTAPKLINYLIKNKHWSPFEMTNVVLEVITTRDIARQILRHRSFSFQEFSQRYADPTKELDFIIREARLQDNKNRQNSVETDEETLIKLWNIKQQTIIDQSKQTYEWAIKSGIAKEQARAVLPEGLTLSKLYINGNLRSWIHYCLLRMGNGTQKEHKEIATECWNQIKILYPSIGESVKNLVWDSQKNEIVENIKGK
jgi:thymidylate synthase (FAD)